MDRHIAQHCHTNLVTCPFKPAGCNHEVRTLDCTWKNLGLKNISDPRIVQLLEGAPHARLSLWERAVKLLVGRLGPTLSWCTSVLYRLWLTARSPAYFLPSVAALDRADCTTTRGMRNEIPLPSTSFLGPAKRPWERGCSSFPRPSPCVSCISLASFHRHWNKMDSIKPRTTRDFQCDCADKTCPFYYARKTELSLEKKFRLSPSYIAMATNADQRKWRQVHIPTTSNASVIRHRGNTTLMPLP